MLRVNRGIENEKMSDQDKGKRKIRVRVRKRDRESQRNIKRKTGMEGER